MALKDTGDIVKAVGFVAIYFAIINSNYSFVDADDMDVFESFVRNFERISIELEKKLSLDLEIYRLVGDGNIHGLPVVFCQRVEEKFLHKQGYSVFLDDFPRGNKQYYLKNHCREGPVNPENIKFKVIEHGTLEYKNAVLLRERILRAPFGLNFSETELLAEKHHIQIIGLNGSDVVATAVLVPEGQYCKMQRVVVKEDLVSTGIGSKLMAFCEAYAKKQGFKSIYCHARDSAVHFYLKNNYRFEGDYFDEDTIPHLKMGKIL